MKYNNGEVIRVNDVIRVHLKDNINDNKLAIINRIKDNFLYCESIANGLPSIIAYNECELCYRNDKDTIFYWRRIYLISLYLAIKLLTLVSIILRQ